MYDVEKFWSFAKYNNNLNKEKFLNHLQDLKNHSNEDFIRAIKLSDVFFNEKASENTLKYVNKMIEDSNDVPDIYKFKHQKKIILDLKIQIDDTIKEKCERFSNEYSPEVFIKFIDIFLFNYQLEANNEVNLDAMEIAIDVCSSAISELFTYKQAHNTQMDSDAYKKSESLYLLFQDKYLWKLIKDAWRFSDIRVDQNGDKLNIEEIGDFGKYKLRSQLNFLDIKNVRDKKYNYTAQKNGWILNNEDYQKKYVPFKKEQLKQQITEYFYTSDFKQEYLGKSLQVWIELYWELFKESIGVTSSDTNKIRNETQQYIQKGGLTKRYNRNDLKKLIKKNSVLEKENLTELLNYLLFNQMKYQSLHNYPLIQIGKQYFLNSQVVLSTDFSRTILNLFIDNNANELKTKGQNFEKYLKNLLSQQLKHKVLVNEILRADTENVSKRESYEVDLITYIDRTVIFIEAKTQQVPETYGDYYKLLKQESDYLKKFKRNTENFINKKRDYILSELDLELEMEEFKPIKIFVSNVTPTTESIDGIFLLDELNFYNFFMRIQPRIIEINKENWRIRKDEEQRYLYEGEITEDKLNKFLIKDNVILYPNLKDRIGYNSLRFSFNYNIYSYGKDPLEIGDVRLLTISPPSLETSEQFSKEIDIQDKDAQLQHRKVCSIFDAAKKIIKKFIKPNIQ